MFRFVLLAVLAWVGVAEARAQCITCESGFCVPWPGNAYRRCTTWGEGPDAGCLAIGPCAGARSGARATLAQQVADASSLCSPASCIGATTRKVRFGSDLAELITLARLDHEIALGIARLSDQTLEVSDEVHALISVPRLPLGAVMAVLTREPRAPTAKVTSFVDIKIEGLKLSDDSWDLTFTSADGNGRSFRITYAPLGDGAVRISSWRAQ